MTDHRMRYWTGLTGIVAALAAPIPGQRPVQRPVAEATLHDGTLSFVGHATIGDFVGTTSHVTGTVTTGPDLGAARGWVEAPVSTLRTGNGLRDRDLRAAIGEEKYPAVRFELAGVTAHAPLGSDSGPAVLHGTCCLHGVTRPLDVPVTLVRLADTVRVSGGFPLNVSRYGVRGLRKMFGMLRVREVVDVRLALRFVIVDPRINPWPGTRP